jgi:formate C-acetyltransferase
VIAMTERTAELRRQSLDARPSISAERAELITGFYRENEGRHSIPVMRALSFLHLCRNKTIYLGEGELIVGERGPLPKAVPTYPELTCHSTEDLQILDTRPKTSYAVPQECRDLYAKKIIPYWRGRTLRDRIFGQLSAEWHDAYEAGLFTEFMEQRAPGHTVLDDKIYSKGMLEFKADIAAAIEALDFVNDNEAYERREQLRAMEISCDAVILFAERHAELARQQMANASDPARKEELARIAEVCGHVPAHAPQNLSPRCAVTFRPTRRKISGRRCNITGSAIWQ